MKRMHVGLGSICIQTKHEIVHAMYVRLVDGGMPYEEEDTCMYVRLLCASHTLTGAGGAGAGAGAPPPPPPAPVCMGARNDSSKALSSSAVPSDSPSLSTCLPAHCKFNVRALPPAHPSTRTHPLSVSASRRWVGGWGWGGGGEER